MIDFRVKSFFTVLMKYSAWVLYRTYQPYGIFPFIQDKKKNQLFTEKFPYHDNFQQHFFDTMSRTIDYRFVRNTA